MSVNTDVQKELDRLRVEWDTGMQEGYDAANTPLPRWYFDKPPAMLTARERGHWFGRELHLQEREL